MHLTEVQAGIDAETEIASAGKLSDEDIMALEYFGFQIFRVLTVAVSTAIVAGSSAVSLAALAAAVAGSYAFLDFVVAVRKFKRGGKSDYDD